MTKHCWIMSYFMCFSGGSL